MCTCVRACVRARACVREHACARALVFVCVRAYVCVGGIHTNEMAKRPVLNHRALNLRPPEIQEFLSLDVHTVSPLLKTTTSVSRPRVSPL